VPRARELGEPGQSLSIRLELRLLADVGLVGLPNVGKSTLLSRISAARPKIADYPFTTLSPVLGVVERPLGDGFVVADLPGLIEGAHKGAGLGQEFLRHVRRTQMLVHLVDVTSSDPWRDYQTINAELREYAEELAQRPQVVALNKMDMAPPPETVAALSERLQQEGRRVFALSALTGEGVSELVEYLRSVIERSVRAQQRRVTPREPTVYRHPLRPLAVTRRDDGAFVVAGTEAERLVAMADLELRESVQALHRALRKAGVLGALARAGAREGDTVVVGDREFEYLPDESMEKVK
jgi:GTP-binding protein